MPVSTARPAFLRTRLITGTGGTVSRELEVMSNRLAELKAAYWRNRCGDKERLGYGG
jgi:hypothetical protein